MAEQGLEGWGIHGKAQSGAAGADLGGSGWVCKVWCRRLGIGMLLQRWKGKRAAYWLHWQWGGSMTNGHRREGWGGARGHPYCLCALLTRPYAEVYCWRNTVCRHRGSAGS